MWGGSAGEESFVAAVFEGSVSPRRRRRRSPRACGSWPRCLVPIMLSSAVLSHFLREGLFARRRGMRKCPSIPRLVLSVSHNGMNGLISCTAFFFFFLSFILMCPSLRVTENLLPAQSFGERKMSFFVTFARFNGFLQSSALLFFCFFFFVKRPLFSTARRLEQCNTGVFN